MKRYFFCLALLLLACTLFSTKIIGIGAKLILRSKYDCTLAYRKCQWEEGQLVFSDLVIFDPSFHTHVEKCSFRIDWSIFPKKLKGHISIDAPHITIKKERPFPLSQSNWLDFSLTVNNGLLDWEGQVQFSLNHARALSQIALDWGNASAYLTKQEKKIDVELNRVKLTHLKKWIPCKEISDGLISGRIELDNDGSLVLANCKIVQGGMALGSSAVNGVNGSFSYNKEIGAKWELYGFGVAKEKIFPIFSSGKSFFQSNWLESEISFDDCKCTVAGLENWTIEFSSVTDPIATWFQSALSLFYPELASWKIESCTISGKGNISGSVWSGSFEAKDLSLQKEGYVFSCLEAQGDLTQDGGSCLFKSREYEFRFAGMWDDWRVDARIQDAHMILSGGWDGEKIPVHIETGTFKDLKFRGSGWIDTHFNASFAIDGHWDFLENKIVIPFYCPLLSKQGDRWDFDFRFSREMWDFFRIAGHYDGKKVAYQPTSQFLGQPIYFTPSRPSEVDLSFQLPSFALLAARPILKEWGIDVKNLPIPEKTDVHFQFKLGQIDLSAKGSSPPFFFHSKQNDTDWEIELDSDVAISASLNKEGFAKGRGKWKNAFETNFEGKIDRALTFAFSLNEAKLDLSALDFLKMEGIAVGGGHFIYNGEIETDLDFNVSSLVVHSYPVENEGDIHLSYKSNEGVLLSGIHLHGEFDCIVDLLAIDSHFHWIFHNAQIHLPGGLLKHKFLQFLDRDQGLNFTANLDFASDFSTFACTVREGSIPFDGQNHHIENLNLSWKNGKCCKASFWYLDHLFRTDLQIDEGIEGRISIGEEEMPLTIDFEYKDMLFIHSIEGAFSGIDASFHAESPNLLVGRAHVNFAKLSPLLPHDVARVFDEIKMGKGYEFKGRLKLKKNLPYFNGILSGKAIELFGFQFRTLLAQVDFAPDRLRIYDMKISDSAGMMKIDELIIEDKSPWTIAMPNLTILEMRPSLLLRPGKEIGPLNPFVIRWMKIQNFKGILDDGNTYTGQGSLHFINSYKREETVFDLPANVLSRIVGLDLDLLVPVTGDLTFEIKDGYFNLLELTNAYSEGKRSQFFLETDPPPRMDLNGNLEIYIKMKQFVLFKITESFLISIDGVLDDPQFRLKKKRFFGLI